MWCDWCRHSNLGEKPRLIRAYFVNVVIALILNKELEIPKQKSLIPCHIWTCGILYISLKNTEPIPISLPVCYIYLRWTYWLNYKLFNFVFEDFHSLPHFAFQKYPINNPSTIKTGCFLAHTTDLYLFLSMLCLLRIPSHLFSILAYKNSSIFQVPAEILSLYIVSSYSWKEFVTEKL